MYRTHHYQTSIQWTGNNGMGTSDYTQYDRSFTVNIHGKPELLGSSDLAFRGDAGKHNPEDMLLMSISSCHMLWYLHLCADAGIVVLDYHDLATGSMVESTDGGHFTEVILNPCVTLSNESMMDKAIELHALAHKRCFIANSCNFPIRHQPICILQDAKA